MHLNLFPASVPGPLINKPYIDTPAISGKILPAVVSLITAAGLAIPVQAQMILEEVLVVAQKRTQNLQAVPVAVTAFSGEDLDISGIKDVFDLSTIAPGLEVRQGDSANNTRFRIRSVGTSSANFGLESAVGLYVDGVYRARQGSMVNNMVDMASVEVLRGPQGTLFGRNTLAGAVLMNTVAPTHDGPEGFAELTAGNYELLNFSGAASISAIEDMLAFRASAFSSQRDGYVDDIKLGKDKIYDRDRWGVRLQALYTPTDFLSVRVIADYSEIDEVCCAALVVQDNLRPVALPAGAIAYAGTDEVARALGGTVFTGDQFYHFKTALNFLPVTENEDSGVSVTVEWDLEAFTLTSITGYRSFESHDKADLDANDLDSLNTEATADQRAWSQELRISNEGERLSYVTGLYYFNQDLDNFSTVEVGEDINGVFSHSFGYFPGTNGQFPLEAIPLFPLPSLPLFPPNSGAKNSMQQEHEAFAVFGQADYYLTDTLMLTAGLRYTHEAKDLFGVFTQGTAPDFTDNVIAPPVVLEQFHAIAPQAPVDESLSDGQVTGTLKLSRFINDDVMIYASYGTGYKSGGTNTDRINPVLDYVFDPETSKAFEIGLKADFPEQALRLNIALHKTDIKDLQLITLDAGGPALQNAGKIDTWGGEVEVTWFPSDSLTVTGAYAKTVGRIEDWETDTCWIAARFHTGQPDPGDPTNGENTTACDRSGDDLPFNPDFLLLTAKQAFDVSDGIGGFLLIEYNHVGETTISSNDSFLQIPSYDLLNLRLAFQFDKYDTAITLWGRNILDEEYRMAGFDPIGANGRVVATPREPATYGITLRKNF
jgi:outer membrane receptor protein involved in Fe transport